MSVHLEIPSFVDSATRQAFTASSGIAKPAGTKLRTRDAVAFQGALDDLLELIEAGYVDEELRALAARVNRYLVRR